MNTQMLLNTMLSADEIERQEDAREARKAALEDTSSVGMGNLADAAAAIKFIMGGNAHVTFVSTATGTRFTYRVRSSPDGRVSFVALLTGPDNTSAYTFFGTIFNGTIFRHSMTKTRISPNAPGAKAFAWAFPKLAAGVMPPGLEVHHEGRCGRCGRVLTVPESILSGFGPECAKRG